MRRSRGFSLIEMAIVLFITALVLGAIVAMANAQIANQRQAASGSTQQAIKTALINFIARNYRLPCPADRTIVAGATGDGVELPNPGACQVTVGTPVPGAPQSGTGLQTVVTGAIPWSSLGLPQTVSLDGFSNRFTYQVTLAATANLNSQTISGMRGAITIHSSGPGTLGGSNANPPGNQINDCTPPPFSYTYAASKNPCAAVAVIVSHGANGYGAFSTQGTQVCFSGAPPCATVGTLTPGADEFENADGNSMFVVKQYTDSQLNPFDDLVLALTPSDFLMPLVLAGTLQDARGALNTDVQTIKGAIIGYAVAHRTGSPGSYSYALPGPSTVTNPPYPDCTASCPDGVPTVLVLPTAPVNVTSDPWGHHIRYSQTLPSITCSSVGSAYTLISDGPDNTPVTSDDISYSVTAADLVAVLSLAGC